MNHRLPGRLHRHIAAIRVAILASSLAASLRPGMHAAATFTLVVLGAALFGGAYLPAATATANAVASAAAPADEPAIPPASSPSAPAAVLLSPTLGRPVFDEPGATLEVLAQARDASGPVKATLVSRNSPAVSCSLTPPADAASCLSAGRPLLLHIPPDLPERTYDLELTIGGTPLLGRHCVAIKRLGRQVRIVHLSNMNIGDLAAPDFDPRLVADVNLVAPDLIVASGDFVDRTADNPDAIWQHLPDFFSRFDAPAFIACGDHDDLQQYSEHVAANPIGTVDLGFLRGFVIYDRPSRPISDDPGQQQWLERALTTAADQRLKFVLAHDDRPNLLLDWHKRGVLADMISSTRLGLWICGSHRDWDGVEYAGVAREAAPLLYVRTHQSSTAPLDGASGVSHFRVLDVTDERVASPGWNAAEAGPPPSLPAGLLNCATDCPNDGTENRVGITVANNHPFRINGLQTRVLVAGRAEAHPWCLGAELVSSQLIDGIWDCRLQFDLPDKGAARAVVGAGSTPVLPRMSVRFELPAALRLVRQQTPEGLTYATAGDVNALIYVTNSGAATADVTPVLRLDGDTLGYKVLEEPGPPAAAYHLHLAPQGAVTLQPDLAALRAAPGRRELQVYMTGLPAWTPACQPLTVVASP